MKFKVYPIESSDYAQIGSLGKICLPIYYNSWDLFMFGFDKNHILLKIESDGTVF